MNVLRHIALAAVLSAAAAAPAFATSYNFSVDYSGGGVAALAGGSDNPLTTTLQAGDSFNYSLKAVGAGEWTVNSGSSIFPLFSLQVLEAGTRSGDFTLDLINNGSTVFSHSELGASNSAVHLGTNTVSLPTGLVFDTFSLNYSILTATVGSTPQALLPWPGSAPELYSPNVLSFDANPVPEPTTGLLLLAGVGALGMVARRDRKA